MPAETFVSAEDAGRSVIPGRLVRVSDEAARVGVSGLAPSLHEPRVEMIRDGDRLQAIDIVCRCGERIRLRCMYDDAKG